MAPHADIDVAPAGVASTEPLPEPAAKLQVGKFPKPPKFANKYDEREYLKGRLAAAFRIFAKYGFDEGVAGHITLRDPVNPQSFWVNPFGMAFALIKKSDLIQVNEKGEIIGGAKNKLSNTAAFMLHSAVHKARPDVMAVAHAHSVHGRAFSALGRKLDTITLDSCYFFNDHVLYEAFNGLILAAEEGENIAKCLGDKKAALLQNHGLLTVGQTVEEAVFWFVSMESCCRAQLLADAAAGGRGQETKKIDEEDAIYTYNAIGSSASGYFNGLPLFEVLHKETAGNYLE